MVNTTVVQSGEQSPTPRRLKPDWLLFAILAVAAFLLFYNLGQRPFWQDEAETGCLARSVLRTGLPYAWDGTSFVSQEEGREFNTDDGCLWRWSPWEQIYLQAAGFAIGGFNAAAGRAPFALAALLAVFWTYRLLLRHFGDRSWALVAMSLLAFSVPFLLIGRQARYYAVGTLLILWTLDAFLCDWRTKWRPWCVALLCLVALFHANYLLFLSFVPTALMAAALLYPDRVWNKRTLYLTIATILCVIPGIFLYRVGRQSGMFNLLVVPENLMLYLADLFMFVLPLPVALVLAWHWRRFFTHLARPEEPRERFALFCLVLILLSVLLLSLVPQRFFRYIAHLVPLCMIVISYGICRMWRFSRPIAVTLWVLLACTNWLYVVPLQWLGVANQPWKTDFRMLDYPNFPIKLFVTELTCGYPDVNAAIVEFFRTHAKPGQTVLAEYGDMPLHFYLPSLRVIGGLQGPIAPNEKPDWVLRRRAVRINRDRLLFGSQAFTQTLELARDYERVFVDSPDETFGNRTDDPNQHHFVPVGPPQKTLEIWRRREGSS